MKYTPKILFLYISIFLIGFSSCSTVQYKDELAKTYYNLGNSYRDLGRLKDSEMALARAIQIDPSLSSAAYNLGMVQIQIGDYKRGIKGLKKLLEKDPDNTLILEVLAWGYYKYADISQAITVYQLILNIDQYNKNALNNVTILMMDKKMYKEAYPYLVQLESLGDADVNTIYNRGIAERELDISSGLVWFESAYKKAPKMEKVIVALIDALKEDHDFIRVVKLYDVIISLDPDPSFYFEKAFTLLTSLEDYNLGIPALETAFQKGFSNLDRINELMEYPDLLDRDKILSIVMKYPLKTPPEGPAVLPENLPSDPAGTQLPVAPVVQH